jgi:hypothetical protein
VHVFQCCFAGRDGEYYAFCEFHTYDISDALERAWNVMDMLQGCCGMSIFCGNVRVFTNVEYTKPQHWLTRIRRGRRSRLVRSWARLLPKGRGVSPPARAR